MRYLLAIAGLAALVFGACGGDGAWGDDTADVDGGTTGDASPNTCDVGVTFMPASPSAGDTVVATASIPDATGFLAFTWSVQAGTADVPFTPASMDGDRIMFTAAAGGPHYVAVEATGTECQPFDGAINVRVPGATDTPWRLRFTAQPGYGVPAQERVVVVPSGADFDYGEVTLDPGAVTIGTLRDTLGAPTAGYLHLRPAASPELVVDAFAGTDGEFQVISTLAPHDVLIIPFAPNLAPLGLESWTPVGGAITVDQGTGVTGTVLDPTGAGLVGATVTVRVDGVPSTVGTTTTGGAFSVRARPATGALVTVDVVPPAASGLPRLRSSPAVLDLTMSIAVSYAATLDTRDLGGTRVEVNNVAAPGAEVTFVGNVTNAGVVATGLTQAAAAGSFAIAAIADGNGDLPATLIPDVAASAVVHTASTWSVLDADLPLDAEPLAAITGRVVDPAGAPVTAATIRAIPTGALAIAGATERRVDAAPDGTFTLALADGGSYDLVVVDRDADLALSRVGHAVAGAASLGDLELPDGLTLTGKVALGGGTAAGVAVTMFASASTDVAAEAATDSGGRYRATVLDPGVQ